MLGDVEIHFTHYKTSEEAETKWIRRTERMLKIVNKDNYFFKICDALGDDEELMKQFHNLPYKNKISFILKSKKRFELSSHIGIIEHHEDDKILFPMELNFIKFYFCILT